uniref:Uncharacterized protein n=1 Tax=Caenorhabditis japonica TaxID=281687 RepID=A0A8R1I6P0_CAEJA
MSCRSLVSLIFLCLLNTPLVECRFLDNNGYNFRPSTIVNDVFYGRKVPDFCLDYFNSSSAKLKIANINRGAVQKALEREEEAEENMQELRDSIENHAQQQYSNHICDAREFAPTVLSSRHEMNCVEVWKSTKNRLSDGFERVTIEKNVCFTVIVCKHRDDKMQNISRNVREPNNYV